MTEAEAILNGPDYFRCMRQRARVTKQACLEMQDRAIQKLCAGFLGETHPCLNCSQGAEVRAELTAGIQPCRGERRSPSASAGRPYKQPVPAPSKKKRLRRRQFLFIDFKTKPEVLDEIEAMAEQSGDSPQTVALAMLAVMTERVRKIRSEET
jgi:hypothetical protein